MTLIMQTDLTIICHIKYKSIFFSSFHFHGGLELGINRDRIHGNVTISYVCGEWYNASNLWAPRQNSSCVSVVIDVTYGTPQLHIFDAAIETFLGNTPGRDV